VFSLFVAPIKRQCVQRPAAARHPFEIYVAVRNVEGMKPGVYHYLQLEHIGEKKAVVEFDRDLSDYEDNITDMLSGQKWAAAAQVVIVSVLSRTGESGDTASSPIASCCSILATRAKT